MARRRFFVPEIRRGTAELTGADAEHLVRVLRVEPGQLFEISDDREVYLAEVESARKSLVVFQTLEALPLPEPSAHVTLCAALIKFERLESLIEKVTELDAAALRFFPAIRSEHGLDRAASKRLPRWQKIAREASQQSRRTHLPLLEASLNWKQILETPGDVRLLLDESASTPPLLGSLPSIRTTQDRIVLLVGPEGGWTDDERTAARSLGWLPCSLGSTILRTETAAIAALAVVQAAWAEALRTRQADRETTVA